MEAFDVRTVFLTSFSSPKAPGRLNFAKFGRVFKFEASREAVQCRIQGISMTQKLQMLSKVHDFSETKRWHQECRAHGDLPISVDISSLEMAECCHNCLGYPWIFISLGYIMTSCEWTFSNQQILWKGYMYNYIICLLWYMYINDKIYDMYFLKHAIYDYIIYRVKLLLFRIFYVFMYRDCLMVIVSVGCLIRSSSIRSSPQQQAEWWVGREPCLETAIFHFFPSHLIVRHFIHLIHFILFTSLKSKHPVRRCLGTCLTHSKTGRRDWNIRFIHFH